VEEDEEDAKRTFVEEPDRIRETYVAEVRFEKDKEVDEEAMHEDPTPLILGEKEIGHKHAV
jgi:hypothetical protein